MDNFRKAAVGEYKYGSDDAWSAFDDSMKALAEAAKGSQGKRPTAGIMRRALSRDFNPSDERVELGGTFIGYAVKRLSACVYKGLPNTVYLKRQQEKALMFSEK